MPGFCISRNPSGIVKDLWYTESLTDVSYFLFSSFSLGLKDIQGDTVKLIFQYKFKTIKI